MTEEKPLRLSYWRVTNFMRIVAAEITPADGPLTILAGENGEGKTSCLEALAALLNAKPPAKPIRDGASQATVEGELSNGLQIKRVFRTSAAPRLELRLNGTKLSSPAGVLEALHSMSFDPLAFDGMKPDKRGERLRKVLKLDWTALEAKEKELSDQRTEVGREERGLKARLGKMDLCEDAPAEPASTEKLMTELERRRQANRELEAKQQAASRRQREAVATEQAMATRLEELQAELERLRQDILDCEADIAEAQTKQVQAREDGSQALAEVSELSAIVPEDEEEARQQVLAVEAVNERYRGRQDYLEVQQQLAEKSGAYRSLTAQIDGCRAAKARDLAEANFPVEGLGFDEAGGVTLNGVPWEQACETERITMSVLIGAAANPELKLMIVRQGSALTKKSQRVLAEAVARVPGAHCVLEDARASEKDAHVVIEGGRVKEVGDGRG